MNLSGEAVSRLVRWYRLPPENLMVVYDDVLTCPRSHPYPQKRQRGRA